jgi:hypothetical protein
MLADHPTWPKKLKKDMNEEEVVFPTLAQQQGTTTPPLPTPAQQAKPCPFCGSAMTVTNVSAPGQIQVGCHNDIGCVMAPRVRCDPADMARIILTWNIRYP